MPSLANPRPTLRWPWQATDSLIGCYCGAPHPVPLAYADPPTRLAWRLVRRHDFDNVVAFSPRRLVSEHRRRSCSTVRVARASRH